MRSDVFALAFLSVVVPRLAAADPAPTSQPERAATPAAVVTDSASPAPQAASQSPALPPASSPAASQPAATKTAPAPPLSADEQRLINQGYKPQMRNGEKVYCRREAELGSRIGGVEHCGTVAQLKTATQDGRDYAEKAQRTQNNPMGK
jgi:hypothetical protein